MTDETTPVEDVTTENIDVTFEPELDADLFDEEDVELDDFDEDAFDEEDLEEEEDDDEEDSEE